MHLLKIKETEGHHKLTAFSMQILNYFGVWETWKRVEKKNWRQKNKKTPLARIFLLVDIRDFFSDLG